MLKLKDLKELHDKAYQANQITREQASDDLVFYWVTQWDDQLLNDSQLQYRGQFDILRKAGRQIMSDLRLNPVQPDFKPKNEARDDDAELLDGIYRSADRRLDSQEAYDYATQDAVVCGFGAWELYTEYETNLVGDSNQVIRRKYIPEANNTLFWDPNAVRLDKSDADYVSILHKYSEDGYKKLVKDLTGEDTDDTWQSFKQPEESYTFPWVAEQKKIYVVSFYHRVKIKDKIITFEDPLGEELNYRLSDVEPVLDELIEEGYNVVAEKEIERWEVRKYIASGNEILNGKGDDDSREGEIVAGENIPAIPVYGERVTIEGEEYYEGITRLAKDPQRLRNFQMSYLADIVSRSPRPKPIFNPEQVQGFESMYEETGADNNYPYLLQNRKDTNGETLPIGPVAVMPEQPMPSALAASIELSRQAVEDVANAGLPQNIADPDLSGKAVHALQSMINQQSYIYQHNFKHAKKRDAEVYASMASQILDTPRTVSIETADGTMKQIKLMESITDTETGELVTINDLTGMEFDVYAEIGQSYQTQKDQTREELGTMFASLDPNDPLRNILLMKSLELMNGADFNDIRDYARKELILKGIKDPETDEEIQMVQAAQQNQQPDAMTLAALAEMEKAKVGQMDVQRKGMKDQADIQNDRASTEIDAYEAQTKRFEVEVDAAEADANLNLKKEGQFWDRVDKASRREIDTFKANAGLRARVGA